MSDCIFCKIAAGDIPAAKVYEDDTLVVFKDLHPVAPVHLLVVPRKHAEDILELAGCDDGAAIMGAVLQAIPRIAAIAGVDADGLDRKSVV